jgi:small-conductance mechanosensitive channel
VGYSKGKNMDFKALLGFNSMITPMLITGFYWLLLVVLVLSVLFGPLMPGGFVGFLGKLVMIVVGAVLIRVWCELLIVIFKINDNLKVIRERGQNLS